MANMYISEIRLKDVIRSYGYYIEIDPIMGHTPIGMLDDAPDTHRVRLERYVQIKGDESDTEVITKHTSGNHQFNIMFGYDCGMSHRVYVDDSGIRWYKHSAYITIKRNTDESDDDYGFRIAEILMKFVIKQK